MHCMEGREDGEENEREGGVGGGENGVGGCKTFYTKNLHVVVVVG